MTATIRFSAVVAAAAALLSGCSSSGSDPAVQGTLFGSALVELHPDEQYALFTAQFYDATPAPADHTIKPAMNQNGCQLMVPVTCDPGCAGTEYCTVDKKCVPRPAPIGAGTLHVEGLGGMVLDLDPTPPMNNYSGPTLQPFPPCIEGSEIMVSSEKFNANIKCITALMLTSAVPIPVTKSQPMHISWAAPGMAGISRVQIELEISHHGGFKGQIDCDVPDTGSFDIPAPLVTALVDLGLAGFPSVKVWRSSQKAATGEPGAKLTMPSLVEVAVDTGVISCGLEGATCPNGMTCDDNFKICK
jgi:hypothetical protein